MEGTWDNAGKQNRFILCEWKRVWLTTLSPVELGLGALRGARARTTHTSFQVRFEIIYEG